MTKADSQRTLARFYAAFAERDGATMAACYAPGATFADPVFTDLSDGEPGAMWRMLTSRARDLKVVLVESTADEHAGSAFWVATYTFAQTGRPVMNKVRSTFRFDDSGRITGQRDEFGFHRWARQALGLPGLLLGWTPMLRKKVQHTARAGLDVFRGTDPDSA
ncbi:MAG: nuclear transport factor 2 family protein [Frankia sp.]|nr:nuclear transport factor 2 family protein [Frankia sp.]